MNKLNSQALLVLLISTMMIIYVVTLNMETQEVIMSGLAIALILLALFLERLFPYSSDWNKNQGDLGGDISSFILIFGILDALLKWATPFLLLIVLDDWSQGSTHMPLWLEIIAVGLLIELGAYISHRLHHDKKWFWSLHAMHHSPERLYTLNNFRFHPLNHIINHLFLFVPAILLGFSGEAILGYTAFSLPVLLLQHSNIDFKLGWINYVLNTNEVHRWHHSAAKLEGNSNLGRALVIWDQLLGTYYFPQKERAPKKIGLFAGSQSYPAAKRYLAQLMYPFCSKCCEQS